jgi:AcrR family transcriptional regulator
MLRISRQNKRKKARRRDPQRTRDRLLQAAFNELYRSGYQGTDLDTVVERAGVTKGALYHHFDGKEALGFAVVEEVIGEMTRSKWVRPLQQCSNPIDTLIEIVQGTSLQPENLGGGCPLNNLAQEMSSLDEAFRKRMMNVFAAWQAAIAAALRDGQIHGLVRNEIDPEETATYLVALYEGYISLAKNAREPKVMQLGIKQIAIYLEALRTESRRQR